MRGICLAGPTRRAGARCELGDGWGLPWGGSPRTATWEHPSTPPGKGSSSSATSLSGFSGRYPTKPELPERETASLAEDDRDAPCTLLRTGPQATSRPGRVSSAGLLLPFTPRFILSRGYASQVTLARLEGREAFTPRVGLGPVLLLTQVG